MNLFKTNVVQRALRETANQGPYPVPRIHGLVFNPREGVLKRLPVDFAEYAANLDGIYDLLGDLRRHSTFLYQKPCA